MTEIPNLPSMRILDDLLPSIEMELKHQVDKLAEPGLQTFKEILTYHMGWSGQGSGPNAQGKRIRPLLLLLSCAACGADWHPALPAGASVELVHNFSLIHDDIQDNSLTRRGRETVWVKWGIPQGINAGDALFVIAEGALLDLYPAYPAQTILKTAKILSSTCLNLTKGQFLDILYEKQLIISKMEYWQMISGKTGALLSACCEMGAILGNADQPAQEAWSSFGHYLGLAFQIKDDFLGIWGDEAILGKSIESDLLSGKKTLPVIYGIEKKGKFFQRWMKGAISQDEIPYLAEQLVLEGVQLQTQETADQLSDLALECLRAANPQGEAGTVIFDLVDKLLNRTA